MNWWITTLLTGLSVFVATNIDDIVILTLFFSQPNQYLRRHIILGQCLGFTALIGASLVGYFGGLFVPKAWIGLLGFVPIAIGITYLIKRQDEEPSDVQAISGSNVSHTNLLSPQTYVVAATTIANGGDNIGIYVPLFASSDAVSLGVILVVFYVLLGVWCLIAERLTRQPTVAHVLRRYGKAIVPFVLISLGVYILIESGTYRLMPFFPVASYSLADNHMMNLYRQVAAYLEPVGSQHNYPRTDQANCYTQ